ncbi:MAG TPA: acyl-CoA carboxylase epsilon subunit [Marmoricola sp.]|nr:acyl-CoA carboxylase epsilon subunit [Marmoricola sp.]HNN48989.1 acyl-CoA carboxylase epsilon subunit [Marmoricola sp.]HNO39870.1 acyl-CoA carboxylase epsilon subunit [Marmoricola sp.]
MTENQQPEGEVTPAVLRVITPNATAEEVAALVAVLAASGTSTPSTPAPRTTWAAPHRATRDVHHPRPGAWRVSALPR